MWNFSTDSNKWLATDDKLVRFDYELFKQELQSVRFWSKCLSGATYLPVNDLSNIYDILGDRKPKNWYIGNVGSPYSISSIPAQNAEIIGPTSSYDYYMRYQSEYGLTLKNLFTPNRLIKDSLDNYNYVDVATVEQLDLNIISDPIIIDGVRLLEGHLVLVKDQVTNVTLLNTESPLQYFISNYRVVQDLGATIEYQYFNEDNGIYLFTNGRLVKTQHLDDYKKCIRFSVNVKLGVANSGKQFHLRRLLSGYYPTTILNDPIEFSQKTNYILRNKVDYNNLFETNYHDIITHATQSYTFENITYTIPKRTISVGEFGVIVNNQNGVSNVIFNKFKVDLRSISQTSQFYWICGDDNTLLKVRKHNFEIERIKLEDVVSINPQIIKTNLYSVSFFNDLRGVVVGELNTIYVTKNGGYKWDRIELDDFEAFNYTKVLFDTNTNFYIAGKNGVFIEMVDTIEGWVAYRRRISKIIDDDDEYVLVDDVNDIFRTNLTTWTTSYNYSTSSISNSKEVILLATNNNGLIVYDMNNSFTELQNDFIYFDFSEHYGDIRNITRRQGTDNFYFTGTKPVTQQDGIFSFDINNFPIIGTGSSYSNTAIGLTFAAFEAEVYPNEIFDFESKLYICGNNALQKYATYSVLNFNTLDANFEEKLKSKLLFLDYDIAGKLNFFTDDGDYRLPVSVTFSNTGLLASGSYVDFKPLTISATGPSFLTQSETNWFTYWADTQKTFEFYTLTPMDESVTVRISSSFSYSPISSSYSISTITASQSQILYLAPNITSATYSSRFDANGLPSISAPTIPFDIYLYDYLMVARVATNFPVNQGDIMRFQSSVVDIDVMVNKIFTSGGSKYIYMFTEFNSNIIKELTTTTGSVSMINLNKYSSLTDLHYRLNEHPIGYAYKLEYSDQFGNVSDPEDVTTGIFKVSSLFNNLTSYYNLGANVIVSGTSREMKYTTGFLDFGFSPTYNILTYLEAINRQGDINPPFYATKEYVALPVYRNIPLGPLNVAGNAYIDYNGMTYSGGAISLPSNKILFENSLYLEWQTIMKNTFVDVIIYGSATYSAANGYRNDRLLVIDKYVDEVSGGYVVEFHRRLDFPVGSDPVIGNGGYLDIISRRTLKEISDDLQELNNIQRIKGKVNSWKDQNSFINYSYQRDLNYKISTDSYAKILLSDNDTVANLSAMIYVDDKYELAMNITSLTSERQVQISNTSQTSVGSPIYDPGKLYISCSEKHLLTTGDGIVIEFNGGTGSSQQLNQQYFGYRNVIKVTDYDFVVDLDFGTTALVGNDSGVIRYIKQDPFFGYQPIDLIEYGVDKKGKQSIELAPENLILRNTIYSIENFDPQKYRFRLVDGLNLDILSLSYPWLLEAEITGAVIGISGNQIIWYKGTWECGRWFGGVWNSGVWMSGDWYEGTWNSYKIKDNILSVFVDTKTEDEEMSIWYSGRWFNGTWNNGTWNSGRWYDGIWNNGIWYGGTWNDGTWMKGRFTGGIWILGKWENGAFNCDNGPAYWLDGEWSGGDFENGMWYNGIWRQKNGLSRFGTNAYNSRTATWQGGKWLSGSFFSRLNVNDDGFLDVSDSHKLSIWKTGLWVSGDWYGGIAYNMDWRLGTWHGGILDEIQVIGINTSDNSFILNGIFKFNIGDNIYIIDNELGNANSVFGSNANPGQYKILYCEDFTSTKTTKITVNRTLASVGPSVSFPTETGLRVVSNFTNLNWKSGIWTNGIYETGLWEGGIWYAGIFNPTWM